MREGEGVCRERMWHTENIQSNGSPTNQPTNQILPTHLISTQEVTVLPSKGTLNKRRHFIKQTAFTVEGKKESINQTHQVTTTDRTIY